MIYGGIYIAPADTFKLCDSCIALLDLVWDGRALDAAGPRG
jgi:hypothetical protein